MKFLTDNSSVLERFDKGMVGNGVTSDLNFIDYPSHSIAPFSTEKPSTAGDTAFKLTSIRSGGAGEFRLRHRVMGDDF